MSTLRLTSTAQVAQSATLNILVHGPAGSGKTWLARTTGDLKRTLIVATEPGLLTLRDVDIPVIEASAFETFCEVYWYLHAGQHGYRWIIIDSISEVAESVLARELAATKDGRKAYGAMATEVARWIRAFRSLPLHLVCTCKQGHVQDETGQRLYSPELPGKKLAQSLPYLFDEVFALRAEQIVTPEGTVTIARQLQTACDGIYDAKDRSGALELFEPPDLHSLECKIMGTQKESIV